MAIDIHGKWQKREKNSKNWQDVKGEFKWFNGNRCREFFFFLNDFRNNATDEVEKELMVVLSEDYDDEPPSTFLNKSIDELNSEGCNFWGAGYLTLEELNDLKKLIACDLKETLESFTQEIEANANDKNAEYRVIFVFDN